MRRGKTTETATREEPKESGAPARVYMFITSMGAAVGGGKTGVVDSETGNRSAPVA